MRFPCPYLSGEVGWTDEREHHVATRHPELIPAHQAEMAETIADPDEVRVDPEYPNTRLFCRRFADLMGGKSVVIAVVSTPAPDVRHWIVTAWVTGKPPKGDVEWMRP